MFPWLFLMIGWWGSLASNRKDGFSWRNAIITMVIYSVVLFAYLVIQKGG